MTSHARCCRSSTAAADSARTTTPLGFTEAQSLWVVGRTSGHLGTRDGFAGLAHLVETDALRRGDKVLLFGVGVGFSLTAGIVEVLDVPAR